MCLNEQIFIINLEIPYLMNVIQNVMLIEFIHEKHVYFTANIKERFSHEQTRILKHHAYLFSCLKTCPM